MPSISIDESRYPIVVVSFNGLATDAEFKEYLDRTAQMMARRDEPNVTILDARAAGPTPPRQRKLQAEWIDTHRAELSRQSLGTAFVIDSALVRGVLTAILWLSPMPSPHVVVRTMEEAESWAHERLAARQRKLAR